MITGECQLIDNEFDFEYMPGCKLFIIKREDGLEDTYSPDEFFAKFSIVDCDGPIEETKGLNSVKLALCH